MDIFTTTVICVLSIFYSMVSIAFLISSIFSLIEYRRKLKRDKEHEAHLKDLLK